ncbi:hypothetical protein CMI37_29265 [Candidatus Pacearchaeota archaeon]|jgi:hypothetical protein|nr:hypothetical protein [Candidatus Pacearchaeota archaeon]|tara:strand:- start:1404 stop:1820 length:417 start_codon:yes stop_codon:yes gene_type:complete
MADVNLKSSGINGGTAVNLQGVDITYKWSNFINVPDVPSKFAATDAQVEVDFIGWTNPVIVIRGVIDTNNAPTNSITLALLKSFLTEKTNAVYIQETVLFSAADTTQVQLKDMSLSRSKMNDHNEGRMDYQITMVETL